MSKAVRRLFRHRRVYDTQGTNELFARAVRDNALWHYQHCAEYRAILDGRGFHPDMLRAYADLRHLPPIPTLYLKQNKLLSIPEEKLRMKATTSGTSGKPAEVGFDTGALALEITMLLKMSFFHRLISARPCNYLVLGYQPSKRNRMGAVRTAYAASLLAPALRREYALVDTGTDYALNIDGISEALPRFGRGSAPVRFIGFPAYFYFLLKKMEQENLRLALPKKSMVFLGGGWKQFDAQRVEKSDIYRMAEERLGIGEEQFHEFFGVVEHHIPYFSCKNHHFHVPVFSRALVRDCRTMEALDYGQAGILNLITPLLKSMPLVSIMTDDIAVLREGRECGCGNTAPWFEILGRAGLQGIKTCAAGAGALLGFEK